MILDIEVLTGPYETDSMESNREVLKGLDISYYDKNGEVAHKLLPLTTKDAYTWQYILPGEKAEPGAMSWDRRPVRKAKSIKLSKFRIEEILSDRADELKEVFEFNTPKKYVIDIETEFTETHGFSTPEAAMNKVTAISIVNCTDKKCTVLAIKEFENPEAITALQKDIHKYFEKYKEDKWTFSFFAFDSEYEMLDMFFGKFIHKMPFITGWNVMGYDWPYLINRADRLGIDPAFASTSKKLLGRDRMPQHRLIVDYLDIVKKWDRVIKIKENYKLDYIAEQCTGLTKIKYQGSLQDLYDKDYYKFIFYNAVDSILVHYIDQKLNTLQTYFKLGEVMRVELNKVFSPVATQDALMCREFYRRGLYSVDVYDKSGAQDRAFEGAFVKDPIPGLHLWVACLDFASLYPNTMMQWNISPETFIGKSFDGTYEENQILCANNNLFMKEDSCITVLLRYLYGKRKEAKTKAKKLNIEIDILTNNKEMTFEFSNVSWDADYTLRIEESKRLSILARDYKAEEQAIKLVINSFFGALGNKWMTFFNPDVAETITLQGQNLIKYADKMLNRYFQEFWHKDVELHELLGITSVNHSKFGDLIAYCDTDSVAADTTIRTDAGVFEIQHLFDLFKHDGVRLTATGNEMIDYPSLQVLNWTEENKLHYSPVRRLIRHKVTKKKWVLTTKSGKSITVTEDHSLMVMRDNKLIKVKPCEIYTTTDKIVSVYEDLEYRIIAQLLWRVEEISSLVECEEFNDEYVYDIEMVDDSHTFIGNDILVHNSAYLEFEPVLESCNWQDVMIDQNGVQVKRYKDEKEFILAINKYRLSGYLNKCFEKYAEKWNTTNLQDFELENINAGGIWLAKKKYLLNTVWQDGIDIEPLTQLTFKGVELAQSSTPVLARKHLKSLVTHIFAKGKKLDRNEFVGLLRSIKDEYKLADPDKIAKGQSINDYTKYVLNDTTAIEVASKTPMAIRAAANHNFMVNQDKRWKNKYQMLKSGDKIKFYKVKVKFNSAEEDVFAYSPSSYPYEFAPQIDVDAQFEDTVLDPINRVIVAMGQPPILPGLQHVTMLGDGMADDEDEDLDDYDPFA